MLALQTCRCSGVVCKKGKILMSNTALFPFWQPGFTKWQYWMPCKRANVFANLEPHMKECETLVADSLCCAHHGDACKRVLSMVIVPYQGITQTITSLIQVRLGHCRHNLCVRKIKATLRSGFFKLMVMTEMRHSKIFNSDFCTIATTLCVKYGGISLYACHIAPKNTFDILYHTALFCTKGF